MEDLIIEEALQDIVEPSIPAKIVNELFIIPLTREESLKELLSL
jgi:hypothetical protein